LKFSIYRQSCTFFPNVHHRVFGVISEVDSGFAIEILDPVTENICDNSIFFSLGGISTGIIGIHSATVRASLMMETAEKRRIPRPPGWANILSYFFSSLGISPVLIEMFSLKAQLFVDDRPF
jgi:hypothetical protein